jgi:SAM-dependent methyltransferase
LGLFDSHNAKTAVVICTPLAKVTGPKGDLIYDPISPLWHRARAGLHMPTNINICEVNADGLEVGDARSQVAAGCLKMNPRPQFLFFIDSDVILPYDAFTKLFFRAKCYPNSDIFCGVYCLKNASVPDPLIYTENGQGAFWNWKVGDILRTETHGIGSVHMGCTLIRVSLLERLLACGLVHGDGTDQNDEPFFHTGNVRSDEAGKARLAVGTEDIYFCDKAVRQMGAKILVDTSVLCGHHDKATGTSYGLPYGDGPAEWTMWLHDANGKRKDEKAADGLKLALDLGAGATRRSWPGHVTYTTDIRADTKPDYVQDTRLLNLPANHFDLIASSHHLEHIGRWDQEQVWREIYRVCKPGGAIEHVVPNIEWAAAKIVNKEVDGHVLNVLYGAQEAHGYAREWNLHYFGYTPQVAVALAEQAGFKNVTTEDYNANPDLGYNLIIRGTKPPAPVATPDEEPVAEETPLEVEPIPATTG